MSRVQGSEISDILAKMPIAGDADQSLFAGNLVANAAVRWESIL